VSVLTGEVQLPVVGSVDKRILLGVGGVAAVFLGWRYWQARGSAAYDPDAEAVDPGFEDGGLLPGVAGAVKPGGDYGLPGETPSTDTYGFTGKSNGQWTQYASTQLSRSETWSYTEIVSALGAFIADRPLSDDQVQIVQAAISLAGYPPEGSHSIIPGGNTQVTIAPTGVKVTPSAGQALVSWNAVAGASGYHVNRSDAGSAAPSSVTGTSMTMHNLTPGREYKVQVAALNSSGKPGPWSSQITFKTPAPTLKAPTGLKASKVERTQITVTYGAVAGAAGYIGFRSGVYVGAAQAAGTAMTFGGLKPNTYYTLSVAGRTGVGNNTGPKATIKVKTKK
jgi:hypothetical protein